MFRDLIRVLRDHDSLFREMLFDDKFKQGVLSLMITTCTTYIFLEFIRLRITWIASESVRVQTVLAWSLWMSSMFLTTAPLICCGITSFISVKVTRGNKKKIFSGISISMFPVALGEILASPLILLSGGKLTEVKGNLSLEETLRIARNLTESFFRQPAFLMGIIILVFSIISAVYLICSFLRIVYEMPRMKGLLLVLCSLALSAAVVGGIYMTILKGFIYPGIQSFWSRLHPT